MKALLSSFAYVWTLVLHQPLPKLNEEKHVNGRKHPTIFKGRFWTRNWDPSYLISVISRKKFETPIRTSGRNAQSFVTLPSYRLWIHCVRTNMMKWWKVMLARFLTYCRRSLMWTNILTTCLRIVFLFQKACHLQRTEIFSTRKSRFSWNQS